MEERKIGRDRSGNGHRRDKKDQDKKRGKKGNGEAVRMEKNKRNYRE